MTVFEQFDAILSDSKTHRKRIQKASLGLAIPLALLVITLLIIDFSLSRIVILMIMVTCCYMLYKGPQLSPEQSIVRRFKNDEREISDIDYQALEQYINDSPELKDFLRKQLSDARRITFSDAAYIWKAMRDNPDLSPNRSRRQIFDLIKN